MTNFDKNVPFDPGYSPFVISFSSTIEAIKFELGKLKAMHQKKFKFKNFEPTIKKAFKNTISFHIGCMLWAGYIHHKFKNQPKEISDNPFYGISEDELKNYDFENEVDFVLGYIEQYEKDSKYFLGKSADLDQNYKTIAQNYKEFLEINNNFIQTKTTADLKLPKALKTLEEFDETKLDKLYDTISEIIKNAKLEQFLESEYKNHFTQS